MKKYEGLDCILLVDDDEATNFYNKTIIDNLNIDLEVKVCFSAQKALDFLTEIISGDTGSEKYIQPGLIFLDINMPGMSGWDFLERYNQLPVNQKSKIIIAMLTTSPNPEDKEKANKNHIVKHFVNKPLKEEDIFEIIESNFEIETQLV